MNFFKKKLLLSIFVIIILLVGYIYVIPTGKLPNKIDKIYVINLKKSIARRDRIGKEFDAAGLKYEIFDAVNGSNLEIIDQNNKKIKGIDISSGRYKMRLGETYRVLCPNLTLTYKYEIARLGLMGAGMLGAQCSHLEVMYKIAMNQEKFSIILEDDAKIYPGLGRDLDELKNSFIPQDWDIIYLGMVTGKPSLTRRIKYFRPVMLNNNISKLLSAPTGAQAYAINGKSAEKIMLNMLGANEQNDSILPHLIKRGVLNGFFATNVSINQHGHENGTYSTDSDISTINFKKD